MPGRSQKRICVFAGSRVGTNPEYVQAASRLGAVMCERGYGLVYGGGGGGMMGAIADSVLEHGGEAIGVIPRALLERELEHKHLTEQHVVTTMHERKALMADLSNAFLALPGGLGTFEELFEMMTWTQLGIHAKSCAVLNVAGYYDQLLAFFSFACEQGFLEAEQRARLLSHSEPAELLDAIENTPVVSVDERWHSLAP